MLSISPCISVSIIFIWVPWYTYNCCIFIWIEFYHYIMTFFVSRDRFWLKSLILSDISTVTYAFFWLPLARNAFFHLFTFTYLCPQSKFLVNSIWLDLVFFKIHSATLFLLIGEFDPFTFKVIIDRKGLTFWHLLSCNYFIIFSLAVFFVFHFVCFAFHKLWFLFLLTSIGISFVVTMGFT